LSPIMLVKTLTRHLCTIYLRLLYQRSSAISDHLYKLAAHGMKNGKW
jgi:hypothetical protein